jgi:VWFA-related protein
MRNRHFKSRLLIVVALLVCGSSPTNFLDSLAAGMVLVHTSAQTEQSSQVSVPTRPPAPIFKGEQGTQQSEIKFKPVTRQVTIKLQVEDPNGYFLPNLRRDNFVVYEDGVRQKNVSVEVEHAPVSIALLMEFGGRYHELNQALGREVDEIGRQLLNVLGRDDRVAIFRYGDHLATLLDFNQGHELLDQAFDRLGTPGFSEVNLYDALLETLNRVRVAEGDRKAIILISSGLDTFSKANRDQVLQSARDAGIPIYSISLVPIIQGETAVYGTSAPFARIDWNNGQKFLEYLAKVSGGRAYVLESDITVAAIYDDIMENLRLRYVIMYVSSNPATSGPARQIRVELIDPKTGQALKIHDSNGKTITAKVFVQESYTPKDAVGG